MPRRCARPGYATDVLVRFENVRQAMQWTAALVVIVLAASAFRAAVSPPDTTATVIWPTVGLLVGFLLISDLRLWWLICPRFGSGWAAAGVGSIVLATLGGYVLGAEVLGGMHSAGAELYQAFVSGSLVHVVYHQGRHDHDHGHDHDHAHGSQDDR